MSALPQPAAGGWAPPGTYTVPTPRNLIRQRAAYYTRYSTASQFETSTERQIGDCQAYAKRLGLALAEDGVYSDEERSGGYIVNRERLHALLERAQSGALDVVVIADPTRLSRDMVDLGWLWRQLARAGVALHAATRGPLAAADIALYGFLSQEQRQTIATNTAWGRRRMVAEGRVPWGVFYGYRKIWGERRGEIEKHPDQAPVVVRIFELREQGVSLRGIAEALNRDGVEGPGGGIWKTAAVNTVLRQTCYAGILVYGRYKCETNPETGKSRRTLRDESEWLVADVPRLRIVEPAAWERAQAVNVRDAGERRGRMGPKNVYLLSGLVRCQACGSNMIIRGTKRGSEHQAYVCSLKDSSNGCATPSSLSLIAMERAVFAALDGFLSRPEAGLAYLRSVAEETNRRQGQLRQARAALERRIAALNDRLHRTFDDALTEGFSTKTLARLRTGIEAKLAELETTLDGMPELMAPVDVEREAAGLGTLHDALAGLGTRGVLDVRSVHGERLAAAIWGLIDHVVAARIDDTRGIRATVRLRHPVPDDGESGAEVARTWEIIGCGFPPTRSEVWRKAGRRQVEQALSDGNCVLDDATWARIANLVPGHHCAPLRGVMREPRALVDMMLLSARLSRPFSDLPEAYGPRRQLRSAVRSLKASGDWGAIWAVLAAEAPRFLNGAISHVPSRMQAAAPL